MTQSPSTLAEEYAKIFTSIYTIASQYRADGRLVDAIEILTCGRQMSALPDVPSYTLGKLLIELGDNLLWQSSLDNGEYAAPIAVLQEAVAITRQVGDQKLIALALDKLGFAYYHRAMNLAQGDFDEANEYFQQAFSLCAALSDPQGICTSRFHMGLVAERQQNYVEALAIFREVYTLAATQGFKAELCETLRHIGFAHVRNSASDEALQCFEQSLALGEEIGNQLFLPFAHLSVGEIYQSKQQWAQAIEHYQMAHDLAVKLDVKRAIVQSLYSLAEVHEQQGAISQARKNYETAYQQASAINFKLGMGIIREKLDNLPA